jgi:hypothetical protein
MREKNNNDAAAIAALVIAGRAKALNPQEDDNYERSCVAFYTGAPRHLECRCSDRRDVVQSPTIFSRRSRGGLAVTNSYCVAHDGNLASLR